MCNHGYSGYMNTTRTHYTHAIIGTNRAGEVTLLRYSKTERAALKGVSVFARCRSVQRVPYFISIEVTPIHHVEG